MNKKQIVMLWLLIIIFEIIFAFGVRLGHYQAENWSATKVHHQIQVEGYHYCPYCGESLQKSE